MPQTGLTLSRYFDQKTGSAYTNFLDATKKNRLFKDAVISLIERVYKSDFEQKQWDEISFVTKTQFVIPVQNDFIVTAPIQITNIVNVALTVTVTTALPHGLISGQTITLQNVQGIVSTAPINGSAFTLTVTTSNTLTFVVAAFAGAYVANTGSVTSTLFLNDYWHLLSIKCKYNSNLYNIVVSDASNTTPIKIKLNSRNNIRTGEQITISGVLGNTDANGIFFVKSLNDFSISLYADINFQTPIAGNGNYISGGILKRTVYNYAVPLTSDMKIGVLNIPTVVDPYFEIADNQIKLYPLTENCVESTVDYIRQPNVIIDVADNAIDLTTYYPEKFLFAMVDEASVIFAELSRDLELAQMASAEQQKNP